MPNMCPFEERHFLTWIDLNPGFGKNWDTILKKFTNGTFKILQMKVFGPKKFQIPCRESKVPNRQFLISNNERSEQVLLTNDFLTCYWRFLISNELRQLQFKLGFITCRKSSCPYYKKTLLCNSWKASSLCWFPSFHWP